MLQISNYRPGLHLNDSSGSESINRSSSLIEILLYFFHALYFSFSLKFSLSKDHLEPCRYCKVFCFVLFFAFILDAPAVIGGGSHGRVGIRARKEDQFLDSYTDLSEKQWRLGLTRVEDGGDGENVMIYLFGVYVCSAVSNSWRPHGLWPARFLCPWDISGKNTGVDCHILLQFIWKQH